jgi:hypothetical protein
MDKQLIQRLARDAGMPLVTPHQATEAESAERHNERILGIAERFATLVAEECAKIAESAADCLQDSTFEGVGREIRRQFGATDARRTKLTQLLVAMRNIAFRGPIKNIHPTRADAEELRRSMEEMRMFHPDTKGELADVDELIRLGWRVSGVSVQLAKGEQSEIETAVGVRHEIKGHE